MSVTILGGRNAEVMHEISGFSLSTDEFGIDQLTRPFEGTLVEFLRWRKLFKRGVKDAIFPDLWFVSLSATGDVGGIVKASATFKGTVDGAVRAVISMETKLQRTSLKSVVPQFHGTANIEYYAPVTTIRYVSKTIPERLSFRDEMILPRFAFHIVKITGAEGLVGVKHLDGSYSPGLHIYRGVELIVHNGIKADPVGEYYQCEESNEGRIVDVFHASDLGYTSQGGGGGKGEPTGA